jgi:hypothetical protein
MIYYRLWDSAGGWSGEETAADLGANPITIALASSNEGNQIMLTAADSDSALSFMLWDDSAWGEVIPIEENTGIYGQQPFVFLWDLPLESNQRPILAGIGSRSVVEGQNLNFTVMAVDPDSTIPILTASNLPTNASFIDNDDGTGEFSFTPGYTQAGTYTLIFIAGDGFLADSETVTITVAAAPVSYIDVIPTTANIVALMSRQFQALGYDAGSVFVKDLTDSVTWSTTDPEGSIMAGGLYTAGDQLSPPEYYVRAIYKGAMRDSSEISIVAASDSAMQVETIHIGNSAILPAGPRAPILGFRLKNPATVDNSLEGLTVHDISRGAGTHTQLLNNIDSLFLYYDDDDDSTFSSSDLLIDSRARSSAAVVFSFAAVDIPADEEKAFFVAAKAGAFPRDGDTVDLYLLPASDIILSDGGTAEGPGVVNSLGYGIIDGMTTDQIELHSSGSGELTSTDSVYHVMTIDIPCNGYSQDTLNIIDIYNAGTALAEDFDTLFFFADNGNGDWDGAGEETVLGYLKFTGDRWSLSGLAYPLTTDEIYSRFYLGLRLDRYPTSGRTAQFGIPRNGIQVASGNDGPINDRVCVSEIRTIAVSEELRAEAISLTSCELIPGEISSPLLAISFMNEYGSALQYDSIRCKLDFYDPDGAATADLVSQFDSLILYQDGDGDFSNIGQADIAVASCLVSGATAVFAVPELEIAAEGGELSLFIAAAVNLTNAKNGNSIAISIESSDDIYLSGGALAEGDYPLSSGNASFINGFPLALVAINEVESAWLFGSQTRQTIADFVIPGNGYAEDTLESLKALIEGGVDYERALEAIRLYGDLNDDGLASDVEYAGTFALIGERYYLAGLNLAVAPSGQRLLIAVDIASGRFEGGTLNLYIPPEGIKYKSGMNGPDDAGFANPYSHLVLPADQITAFSVPTPSATVAPGAEGQTALAFALYNGYTSETKHLSGLTFSSASKSFADESFADDEFGRISLLADANGNRLPDDDSLLGVGYFVDGKIDFSGFSLELKSESLSFYFVLADLSQSMVDNDSLCVSISAAADIKFSDPVEINGSLPLKGGYLIVDGSVAAQYVSKNLISRSVQSGENDIVLMAFKCASNGNLIDTLKSLIIENSGNASDNDISLLTLALDLDENLEFGLDDSIIGDFSFVADKWVLSDVGLPIDQFSPTLIIVGDISSNAESGRAIRLEIPINGCNFSSGNDGPRDNSVESNGIFAVSGSALRVRQSLSAETFSVGQTIRVKLLIKNLQETPLASVHGAVSEILGENLVRLDSGFGGQISLNGGDSAELDFYYTALSPGSVAWSGQAYDVETKDSSAVVQTRIARIQEPVSAMQVELISSMPTSVVRGQENIFPMSIILSHAVGNSLTAPIRLDSLYLHIKDADGAPIAAADVLSRAIVLTGYSYLCVLDNPPASSMIPLCFAEPVVIEAGEYKNLTLLADIADSAVADNFMLSLDAPSSVPAVDFNTLQPVKAQSSQDFPLETKPCRIDDPSSYLAVSDLSQIDPRVNYGQCNFEILRLGLRHPGSIGTSQIQLTQLSLSAEDGSENRIKLSSIFNSVVIAQRGNILAESKGEELSSETLKLPLRSILTLNPGIFDSISILASVKSDAAVMAFRIIIEDSAVFVARDINSGALALIRTDIYYLPAGSIFPIESDLIQIFRPASDLKICPSINLPASIIAGSDDVALAEFQFAYEAYENSAPMVIYSGFINLIDSMGGPINPGILFNRIGYQIDDFDIVYEPYVKYIGGRIQIDFGETGLLLNAGETTKVAFIAEFESDIPYDHFIMFLETTPFDIADDIDSMNIPRLIPTDYCGKGLPLASSPVKILAPAGRPLLAVDNSVIAAYQGQTALPIFSARTLYNIPGFHGDLQIEGISGRLFRRTPDGDFSWPVENIFARFEFRINDSIISVVPTIAAESLTLSPDIQTVVKNGTELTWTIVADLVPNVEPGNYFLQFTDSSFIDLTDEALEAVIYPIIPNQSFPLAARQISISEPRLDASFSNYPNPFSPADGPTRFIYALPEDGHVDLEIFTITGEAVVTLARDEAQTAGVRQDKTWDGTNDLGQPVLPGVYISRITVNYASGRNESVRRKVAVVR